MIHSFEMVQRANGNVAVMFKDNGKTRSIIFEKDTPAFDSFMARYSISETAKRDKVEGNPKRIDDSCIHSIRDIICVYGSSCCLKTKLTLIKS